MPLAIWLAFAALLLVTGLWVYNAWPEITLHRIGRRFGIRRRDLNIGNPHLILCAVRTQLRVELAMVEHLGRSLVNGSIEMEYEESKRRYRDACRRHAKLVAIEQRVNAISARINAQKAPS